MADDRAEIVFLICDDTADLREQEGELIEDLLADHFVGPIPHSTHLYSGGDGALAFLEKRGNAKGVIPVLDHDMGDAMWGGEVIATLAKRALLPSRTFICSSLNPLDEILQTHGLEAQRGVIYSLDKNPRAIRRSFEDAIPDAIQIAAAEVGLTLNPRLPSTSFAAPGSPGALHL